MKKIISVLLSVIMIFSCLSVSCFAADKYRYVVLGDSIAYGSGLLNASEACYGKAVANTCGFDYANHSVPGATTHGLIYKLNDSAVRSDIARADIISISIGGNDFLDEIGTLMYDAIVKKDYKKYDTLAFGVYSNISSAIDRIRALNDDAVILLQSLYNPQFDYLKEAYQQGADRINDAIYRCAKENSGVVVVDIASALNGDKNNFADDTMHPSAKGNEKIANEVLKTLRRLGYTNKTTLNPKVKGIDVVLGPGVYGALNYFAFFFKVIARMQSAITLIMR